MQEPTAATITASWDKQRVSSSVPVAPVWGMWRGSKKKRLQSQKWQMCFITRRLAAKQTVFSRPLCLCSAGFIISLWRETTATPDDCFTAQNKKDWAFETSGAVTPCKLSVCWDLQRWVSTALQLSGLWSVESRTAWGILSVDGRMALNVLLSNKWGEGAARSPAGSCVL